MGHAAVLARCRQISDDVFLVAAEALAAMVGGEELSQGRLFPRFSAVREVSARLMAACADYMVGAGLKACLVAICSLGGRHIRRVPQRSSQPKGTADGLQGSMPFALYLTLQVRTGLGSLPADFDEAGRRDRVLPTSASNLARWEAYAAAHMFNPNTARL